MSPLQKRIFHKINRRSAIGKIRTKADKVFRQIQLIKRGSQCEWCEKHTQVYVSHILPKGTYPRLRYVELNVLLLCYHCHFYRWHKSPLEAHKFLEERSQGLLMELKALHVTMPRHTLFYLKLLYHSLQREYHALTTKQNNPQTQRL